MMYLSLYRYFLRQQLKTLWQYRIDFIIGFSSILLGQLVGLLILSVIFTNVNAMYGWSQYEVGLMYGFALLARGIAHIFYDNFWIFGDKYIRQGELLRVLIRPINPLMHIMADRIQLDGLGTLFSGIALTSYAFAHLDISFTSIILVKIIYYAVVGSFIYFGVNLITATLSFWLVDSVPLTYVVHMSSDLTRYPLNVIPNYLQQVFIFIIPFAFTSYFPAVDILGKEQSFLYGNIMVMMTVITIVLNGIAYMFWLFGLRNYTGTGS